MESSLPPRPDETELLLEEPANGGDVETDASQDELPGIGFGDFLRMFLVLGGVIILIYGFFWILKRASRGRVLGEETLRLLASQPLKGDAALHLVEVGGRVFLVGSASSSVRLIAEIDDKETVDDLLLKNSRSPASTSGGFARFFKERFGLSASNKGDSKPPDTASFLRSQRERLKKL